VGPDSSLVPQPRLPDFHDESRGFPDRSRVVRPAAANGRQEPGYIVPGGSGKERAQPIAAKLTDAFGRRCRESCKRILTSAATPRGKKFWLILMAAGLLIAAVLGGYAAWELPHDKHSAHKNRNHH